MAKKPISRAQDMGVSTKKLRRMATLRIERMHNMVLAIEQAWDELDDSVLGGVVVSIQNSIDLFEMELREIADYHEQPVELT